ncbi:MAG: RNA methyltransferase [Bacteroidales bacterium]|nr:RNA methyltransferase [Bacteroidales bacterium]
MISKVKIKELKSLQQKKCRESARLYIAEGIKVVNEAMASHADLIELVLFTDGVKNKLRLGPHINSCTVDKGTIEKISSFKSPQECMVVLNMEPEGNFMSDTSDDIILALDSIRDPGNLGTIIRLADWFGVSKIVCSPDSVDCYNPKVVQASMGAILRVKVFYAGLQPVLNNAKGKGIAVYGTTLAGSNIYITKPTMPAIIVMGNESEGITGNLREYFTKELFIPNYSHQPEKTESLNVSAATSIVLSEFRRLQHYSK